MNDLAHWPSERSGFLPDRTVHLHPLARCNLACKHCYSNSSPTAEAALTPETVLASLPHLWKQGYKVISLSGGEPLLYQALPEVIAEAKQIGFRMAAISNGFRVNAKFSNRLQGMDGMAISFDGLQEVHDRVRGNPRAYDMAMAGLRHLVETGIPAAAAFTVSTESIDDVPAFVEMVAEIGVKAVQLRPLVKAGRAITNYAGPVLDEDEVKRLWVMGQVLAQAYDGEVAVHTDLAHSMQIVADRGAWHGLVSGWAQSLSDRVNPLVITPEGWLRPFTFDFPSHYDLGHIGDLADAGWIEARTEPVRKLVTKALEHLEQVDGFIDWFAFLRDQARLLEAV
jgi:Fe-coproporphyrin III synthase